MALDPTVALLLPCNVVMEELSEGRTSVAIADPRLLLSAFSSTKRGQLEEGGAEAAASLEKVVNGLGS